MKKFLAYLGLVSFLFNSVSPVIAEDETIYEEEPKVIIDEELPKDSNNNQESVPLQKENILNTLNENEILKTKASQEKNLSKSGLNSKNSTQETKASSSKSDIPYKEGEVIVKYKDGKESKFNEKVQSLKGKGTSPKNKKIANNTALLTAEDKTTQELIKELQNDPNVEYVQPNFIYYTQDLVLPNDADFDKLWGLHNTGQIVDSSFGVNNVDIDWPEAMSVFSGSTNGTGTIVAVIDTGVNYLHEDLKNKMWDGKNCVSETGAYLGNCNGGIDFYYDNKDPMDYYSHGTHVAGIIGAEMNNEVGITGVNPNAKIMAIKVSDENALISSESIVRGIYFAKNNGAKIINASFGRQNFYGVNCSSGTSIIDIDSALYNAIKDFGDAGGLFIASAGNNYANSDNINARSFPAGFATDFTCGDLSIKGLDNIISVAAIDNNGNKTFFSNYGSESVHIGAPGIGIYSTIADRTKFNFFIESLSYPNDIEKSKIIPDYYTGVITGTGGWGAMTGGAGDWWINGDFIEGNVYGIFPYPDIITEESTAYNKNTTRYLISKSYNLLNGEDFFLSLGAECYNNPLQPNNKEDFISLSISGDGENYTEVFRDDGEGYSSNLYKSIKIPEQFVTSNFSFRWNYTTGNNNYTRLCYISPWHQDLYWKEIIQNQYEFKAGTSMAAPYVAGLASLAWSYRQDLDYKDIKESILKWGDDLPDLNGKTITGKMINANNTLLSLTELTGSLVFESGAYTNSTGITLSFEANKPGTYNLSGDILQTLIGTYLTGSTFNIELTQGDGLKNISLSLEDNFEKNINITGSIILDTTAPVISSLSINSGAIVANGSLILTGTILDNNLKTIKVNGTSINFGSGGTFSTNIPLNLGLNTIVIEAEDFVGYKTTMSIDVTRITPKPSVDQGGSGGGFGYRAPNLNLLNGIETNLTFDKISTESKGTLIKNVSLKANALQKIKNGKQLQNQLDILVKKMSDKQLNTLSNGLINTTNLKNFKKHREMVNYLDAIAKREIYLRVNK